MININENNFIAYALVNHAECGCRTNIACADDGNLTSIHTSLRKKSNATPKAALLVVIIDIYICYTLKTKSCQEGIDFIAA